MVYTSPNSEQECECGGEGWEEREREEKYTMVNSEKLWREG